MAKFSSVILGLLTLLPMTSSAQADTFNCQNAGSKYLQQFVGQWQVITRDRLTPGVYEMNTGQSTIWESIPGCGIQELYKGTFKSNPYSRNVMVIGVDSLNFQMTARDSEHNSISFFQGQLEGNILSILWYRDIQKKRLQSKYILTPIDNDNFEFSSFLSTDYGQSWALTHERKYSRVSETMRSFFVALIVSDLEVSLEWYTKVLGYSVLNKTISEERGFGLSNLSREGSQIELIELDRAVNAKDVIPDFTNRTRLQGIFKIGFQVEDFDVWVMRIKDLEVDVHGEVVKDPISGKRMIILLDPDGNRIQLFEK